LRCLFGNGSEGRAPGRPILQRGSRTLRRYGCFSTSIADATAWLRAPVEAAAVARIFCESIFNEGRHMKRTRTAGALVLVSALGLVVPEHVLRAAALGAAPMPAAGKPVTEVPAGRIADVALAEDGVLHGIVVDSQATVVPRVQVSMIQGDREVARTVSDAEGRFALHAMRGGVYQISAGTGISAYRVWTAPTAPPAATRIALVNARPQIVRGQMPFWNLFKTDAFLIAAVVATAVAIPVAVHNLKDDDDSSS
jgi:hypothetical protein